MKLYTKTGDDGRTGLLGGGRVDKDAPRVESYGAVDELNAALGLAASAADDDARADLHAVQSELFILGTQLATVDGQTPSHHITDAMVTRLEERMDAVMAGLPPLKNFVLPGGCELAARLHLARTICRRAERAVVSLAHDAPVDRAAVVYLNRLGDLLFAWALAANHQAGVDNVPWIAPKQQP